MKTTARTTMLVALFACAASVVPTGGADENTTLSADPQVAGAYALSWWAEPGRTYFVQCSEDLVDWDYAPFIEQGAGATIGWGVSCSGVRLFLRLRSSDEPTNNPLDADFDRDGISNNLEIAAGTDPLAWLDLDGDNLPDDWENFYQVDAPEADPDGDGLSNLVEFAIYGTAPNTASAPLPDTDSDGVPDPLDAFPDDAAASAPPGAPNGDTTAPAITLNTPSGALAQ